MLKLVQDTDRPMQLQVLPVLKFLGPAMLSLAIFSQQDLAHLCCAQETTKQTSTPAPKKRIILQGGVNVNVPRTPEDVARYLARMRIIIDRYEQVAMATLLGGGNTKIDPASLETARGQSLEVIRTIRVIIPPAELKLEHNELANTLGLVGNFIADPGQASGGGLTALAQLAPMLARLHSTLNRYHQGCLSVIAYYGLSQAYDPFAGESEASKQKLSQTLDRMKASMAKPQQPAQSTPVSSGSQSNLLQGLNGLDLSSLGSSLNSTNGLGNLNLGSQGELRLDSQMLQDLSKMLQQLQGF